MSKVPKSPKKIPKTFDLLEIVWVDSMSSASKVKSIWVSSEELDAWIAGVGCISMRSVGYLVGASAKYLTICGGFSTDTDDDISYVTNPFAIPKGCIKSIKKLKR